MEEFKTFMFVRKLRIKAHYNQEFFATALGYPGRKDIVCKLETGQRHLTAAELYNLCLIFDVDVTGKPNSSEKYSFDRDRLDTLLDELVDEYEKNGTIYKAK